MKERLQKIIARAGVTSRRAAEDLIVGGRVSVNGEVVTELGVKADPEEDHIKVDGKLIQLPDALTYLLLNKPKGVVSSIRDPEGRPVVTDLIKGVKGRIYPVGRLDFNSEGVLLLTNDGDLTNQLLAPRSKCHKTYLVKVSGHPTSSQIGRLERGVTIDGVRYGSCKIRLIDTPKNAWLHVVLSEGRKHHLRKVFEFIGNPVSKIRRIAFAFLQAGDLEPGEFRHLQDHEVRRLKRGEYGNPPDGLDLLEKAGVPVKRKPREPFHGNPRATGGRKPYQRSSGSNRDQGRRTGPGRPQSKRPAGPANRPKGSGGRGRGKK